MAIEHKDIAAIREDYSKGTLSENEVHNNPIKQFQIWFEQALDAQVMEPNAMVLSTLNTNGFPDGRVVLLKDIKESGFSFFTNYESSKGIAIGRCPNVSTVFFWPELQRQVRIQGIVERLPEEDSDEYFASRPIDSQIGAWSSPQSQVIDDRAVLEKSVLEYTHQFKDIDSVPRPKFWGGFFIKPIRFEFWQGRSSRLHDRIVYEFTDNQWTTKRIAP